MVCLKESAEAKAILVAFCLFCVLVASSTLWTNSWVATRRYKNMPRDDNVHMKTLESVIFIPSRSSMDFSSLATVLSANSARVSAWQNTLELLRDFKKQNWNSWHYLEHFHVIFQRKNSKCQKGALAIYFTWDTPLEPVNSALRQITPFPEQHYINLTSLSLSVRTLISSSYLSSFSEYCGERQTALARWVHSGG